MIIEAYVIPVVSGSVLGFPRILTTFIILLFLFIARILAKTGLQVAPKLRLKGTNELPISRKRLRKLPVNTDIGPFDLSAN